MKKRPIDTKSVREPSLPTYRQLALTLAMEIKAGNYKIGSMIPSLGESSRINKVSAPTVSVVYDILRKHGIIALNTSNRFVVKSKNIESFLTEELKLTRYVNSNTQPPIDVSESQHHDE